MKKSLFQLFSVVFVCLLLAFIVASCNTGSNTGVGPGGGGFQWSVDTIDSDGAVGQYVSMKFRGTTPRFSYYNETNQSLMYATGSGSSFNTGEIDTDGNVGQYSSLEIDSEGFSHISYYDAVNGNLKHTHNVTGTFVAETVDPSADDTGKYSSIGIDENDHHMTLYYNETTGDLQSAFFNGAVWVLTSVDTADDVGGYTSTDWNPMATPSLTGAGFACSYYDFTNGELKYAYFDGTDWQISVVDSTGDVGQYTSLIFDSEGRPHISYYDVTNGNLKHVSGNDAAGASWDTPETVDSSVDDVGQYTSIALIGGLGRISYYDATSDNLKYARQSSSGNWSLEVVDEIGNVGLFTSLDVDSNGKPGIAYHDATFLALKFARNSSRP